MTEPAADRRRHPLGVDGHRHLEQAVLAHRADGRARQQLAGAHAPQQLEVGGQRGVGAEVVVEVGPLVEPHPPDDDVVGGDGVTRAHVAGGGPHGDRVVGRRQHAGAGHDRDGDDEDADPQPRVAPARTRRPYGRRDGRVCAGAPEIPAHAAIMPATGRPGQSAIHSPGRGRPSRARGMTPCPHADPHGRPGQGTSLPHADRRGRGAQHLERAGLRAGPPQGAQGHQDRRPRPVAGRGERARGLHPADVRPDRVPSSTSTRSRTPTSRTPSTRTSRPRSPGSPRASAPRRPGSAGARPPRRAGATGSRRSARSRR